ncbi:MAG TPA: hypothetical protein VNY55_15105 [Mycobacterium sp.]|nr:hypothetical protein [Mycobacterium sp.]
MPSAPAPHIDTLRPDTAAATLNEDKIAIHIYQRAAGQPITLGTVEHHLNELLSHQPDCGIPVTGVSPRTPNPRRTRAG